MNESSIEELSKQQPSSSLETVASQEEKERDIEKRAKKIKKIKTGAAITTIAASTILGLYVGFVHMPRSKAWKQLNNIYTLVSQNKFKEADISSENLQSWTNKKFFRDIHNKIKKYDDEVIDAKILEGEKAERKKANDLKSKEYETYFSEIKPLVYKNAYEAKERLASLKKNVEDNYSSFEFSKPFLAKVDNYQDNVISKVIHYNSRFEEVKGLVCDCNEIKGYVNRLAKSIDTIEEASRKMRFLKQQINGDYFEGHNILLEQYNDYDEHYITPLLRKLVRDLLNYDPRKAAEKIR